jgi:hypothetical protein
VDHPEQLPQRLPQPLSIGTLAPVSYTKRMSGKAIKSVEEYASGCKKESQAPPGYD